MGSRRKEQAGEVQRGRRGVGTSLCTRMRRRETGEFRNFVKRSVRERFSNFRLRGVCDVFAADDVSYTSHDLLGHRSKILEIVCAGGLIFGLTDSGVCVAFDMDSRCRRCVLNSSANEVVRSLFHNKSNKTLIIVSVYASDAYSSLRCRACRLEDLRLGVADRSTDLFTTESLKWPGFVEFDDVNQKVLTYSAKEKVYKVWNMADPTAVLYSMPDLHISEIKISPGIMLLVLNSSDRDGQVPLRILSIETGQVLREFKQVVQQGKKIDVIEQFNQKLLLKQADAPLAIVDLLDSTVIKVPNKKFLTPLAFILLYEHQCFLAFRETEVLLWNFRGELVSVFDDHKLSFPSSVDDHTSVIFITHHQDVIISLCEESGHRGWRLRPVTIHVSHISTGKCLARIDWHAVNAAEITSLSYNEERGDIIAGNANGQIQIWSN